MPKAGREKNSGNAGQCRSAVDANGVAKNAAGTSVSAAQTLATGRRMRDGAAGRVGLGIGPRTMRTPFSRKSEKSTT